MTKEYLLATLRNHAWRETIGLIIFCSVSYPGYQLISAHLRSQSLIEELKLVVIASALKYPDTEKFPPSAHMEASVARSLPPGQVNGTEISVGDYSIIMGNGAGATGSTDGVSTATQAHAMGIPNSRGGAYIVVNDIGSSDDCSSLMNTSFVVVRLRGIWVYSYGAPSGLTGPTALTGKSTAVPTGNRPTSRTTGQSFLENSNLGWDSSVNVIGLDSRGGGADAADGYCKHATAATPVTLAFGFTLH